MIDLFAVHMPESVTRPLLDVLFSGYIGQGQKVEEFEKDLVPWVQNKHVLTLNSGTSGLHLALKLARIKPGHSVIATPMSCQASNQPIVHAGARIIWGDIDPKTGNMDCNTLESLIESDTKAILCVHYGGYPCDMNEINSIAEQYGLVVIEDAAHAFGAVYQGQRIGSISHFTMFSLQAIKHITTIDGGILTTRNEADYERGRLLRWYGMDRMKGRELRCLDNVPEAGFKFHMNDICATIGIEQLKYAEGILAKHRENASYYDKEFRKRKIKKVKPLKYKKDRLSSYWLYVCLVDDRELFIAFMRERGIHVSRVHSRNDTHSCFKEFWREAKGIQEFDDHQCSIPVHHALIPDDRKKIMDAIEIFDREEGLRVFL